MGVLAHEDRRRVQDPEADRTLVDGKQRLRDDDDHAVEKSAGTLVGQLDAVMPEQGNEGMKHWEANSSLWPKRHTLPAQLPRSVPRRFRQKCAQVSLKITQSVAQPS